MPNVWRRTLNFVHSSTCHFWYFVELKVFSFVCLQRVVERPGWALLSSYLQGCRQPHLARWVRGMMSFQILRLWYSYVICVWSFRLWHAVPSRVTSHPAYPASQKRLEKTMVEEKTACEILFEITVAPKAKSHSWQRMGDLLEEEAWTWGNERSFLIFIQAWIKYLFSNHYQNITTHVLYTYISVSHNFLWRRTICSKNKISRFASLLKNFKKKTSLMNVAWRKKLHLKEQICFW